MEQKREERAEDDGRRSKGIEGRGKSGSLFQG